MLMRNDEALVAYLDGELDAAGRRDVDAWLSTDPTARERLTALAASATLVRSAFAELLEEPVPERLIAAARGDGEEAPEPRSAEVIVLNRRRGREHAPLLRRWMAYAAAAGLSGLVVGAGGGFFGWGLLNAPAVPSQSEAVAAATNDWLNNAAGYYKMVLGAGDTLLADVPANGDPKQALQKISQDLPQQVRLPNLKPWGLDFRGARLVVGEGRPAAELMYTTANKAIGPLALIIGSSKLPDTSPTYVRRQDVNLLYWRHQGRAYVLVGQTDIGYLWGIANDVAWQLDAI